MDSFRKKYFSTHKKETRPSGGRRGFKTVYVYTGSWYSTSAPFKSLAAAKAAVLGLTLLSAAAFFLAALQRHPWNRSPAVAIPATLSLIALMYQVIGSIQLCCAGERVKEYDARDIARKLSISPRAHCVLVLLTSVDCLLLLLRDGFSGRGLLTAVLYLASSALSLGLYLLGRRISFEKL